MAPVMNTLSSSARNSTAAATSSGRAWSHRGVMRSKISAARARGRRARRRAGPGPPRRGRPAPPRRPPARTPVVLVGEYGIDGVALGVPRAAGPRRGEGHRGVGARRARAPGWRRPPRSYGAPPTQSPEVSTSCRCCRWARIAFSAAAGRRCRTARRIARCWSRMSSRWTRPTICSISDGWQHLERPAGEREQQLRCRRPPRASGGSACRRR